jgi:competence protein ComEC
MNLRLEGSRSNAVPLLAVVVLLVLAGCAGTAPLGDSPNATTALDSSPANENPSTNDTANLTAGNLSVHFIDVGQGSSVLVVGPTGETLLYDTGNWKDDGEHVLDYLRARNVTRIDYLVTSHADADHIGGHAEVIDYYETHDGGIGAIYDPGIAAATQTYEEYLDAVEEHDVTLYRTQAGDEIPMDGVSVQVLAPPENYLAAEERNENSLVLRMTYGNASVLLPGDAGAEAERYLTDTYGDRLDATILGAGHHGSNTSTGPGLLATATPRVVAVQSAYDSQYGHPHREVLARLADRGIPTYWTGVHGTVVFDTDGRAVTVYSQRDGPTAPRELRNAPGVQPGSTNSLEVRERFAVGGNADPLTVRTDGEETTDGDEEAGDGEASSSLVVAEIHADAAGHDGENLNDEYVVFRNDGDETLDLSGWTVSDEVDHTYTFPEGITLEPGETLTLHTGGGTDGDGHYYWGSGRPIWNNGGDTVFVRTDEGTLVLEVSYDG